MNRRYVKLGIVVLALGLICWEAAGAADSIRCGGKIIDPGLSLGHVLLLCGPPESRVTREVPSRARNRLGFSFVSGIAVTDRLIYDRGRGRFPAELVFIDGELRRIEYLLRYRR